MEKIIQEVFDKAYELHQKWLNGSKGGIKMDFNSKDLTDIKFPSSANLYSVNLRSANLYSADLRSANLSSADLRSANLYSAKNLIKIMGVEPGNFYWKRLDENLQSNGYYYTIGKNYLRKGEKFAADESETCSYPGFHFASRSWCALNYDNRPLECKIRIPEDAKINEPWATDGKASASAIEIIQVIDTRTGEDVTKQFKNRTNRRGELKANQERKGK